MRRSTTERLSERFYLLCGLYNIGLGVVTAASVLLKISNYAFYPFPGGVYFYTQQIFFVTVDAFEIIGVFSVALGCVLVAFKKNPPQIGSGQIIVGSILMVMAVPLTFIPVQIWIDRYLLYSPILATLDLRRIHGIFSLNFNLFTYFSLIVFMVGMLIYIRVSKIKTAALIGFLAYLYLYPSLRFTLFENLNIPMFTPTMPLQIYAGLIIVLAVTVQPVVSQWDLFDHIRKKFKLLIKTTLLLIVLLSLLVSLMFMTGCTVATPTFIHKGLNPDDKIDPRLLSLNPVPENVSVIMGFDNPICEENKTALSNYDFFTVTRIYEEDWMSYFAIFGDINTTSIDFVQTLKNLARDFPLSAIVYDDGDPSNLPDIDKHYRDYYYVGSDVLRNWNITGRGTTVAVIDSGINDNNEEIVGKKQGRILYQVNFLTGQEGDPQIVGDITPDYFIMHGTYTANMVAGTKGIAPEANIIDLKVKNDNGELYYMTYTYAAEAVKWCIRNKDRFNISVIVLAIGCRDQVYGALTEAVDWAFLNGIIVVTGGGAIDITKGKIIGELMTPGIADWAITVAALNGYSGDCWSPLSPLGPSPHWYLPKPEITAGYEVTSTATSVVAGVALLLAQQCNEGELPISLRSAIIRWALIEGAKQYDLGPLGWDAQYGYGRVNALSSYLFLKYHLKL
ncbi:MAG: S8 family serine peptidase [Candidatus Freyarchaeota archaeon]